MGNAQPSKLMESESVKHLKYLEDGHFSKLYKGQFAHNRQFVTIKVPRVHESVRKEKSKRTKYSSKSGIVNFFFILELVKTHIEEVKKLMPNLKRARSDYIVKYLGVSYDDFRKEVWVRMWNMQLN